MSTPTLWQIEMTPWYAMLFYWAISSLKVKQARIPERFSSRSKHLLFMIAAVVLMFTGRLRIGPLALRFVPENLQILYASIFITCLGVALAIWARYILGQYWSARVEVKVDHQLIASGPYAYVRHPIYTGILLAGIGTALYVGELRAILAITLATVGFAIKAKQEESLMTSEFGNRYQEYRKATGFLIPRVY
ncbi:MAG TPA: isoprenylcysteine carboxylmethyltransferase family protein [Terriglobales bacterium]|nr:isoprenylcysteine carboxylmethyltransferase family protein [Terriglobales bacterium]